MCFVICKEEIDVSDGYKEEDQTTDDEDGIDSDVEVENVDEFKMEDYEDTDTDSDEDE